MTRNKNNNISDTLNITLFAFDEVERKPNFVA